MPPEFDLLWSKLFSLIETKTAFEADVIINFLGSLDDNNKVQVLLLTGRLKLPFQRCSIYYGVSSQACQRETLCSWYHHSQ